MTDTNVQTLPHLVPPPLPLAMSAGGLRAIGLQCSDQLEAFAGALAKAQAEFSAVSRDAKNPHLNSSYADLSTYLEVARPALTKQGIATMQPVTVTLAPDLSSGTVKVSTVLLHSSGQWIATSADFPALPMVRKGGAVDKQVSPQAVGSALTYGRRYALSALLSLASAGEDDDGAASSQQQTRAAEQTRRVEPMVAFGPAKNSPISKLTDDQLREHLELGERQITDERANAQPGAKLASWVDKVTLNLAALSAELRNRTERAAAAAEG